MKTTSSVLSPEPDIGSSNSKAKQPLQVPRAPQIVAARIRRQIVTGQLKEGDSLPVESKLMDEFGISRPTLREAYRILEAERLVSISRGAKGGAVIHAPDPKLITRYALMVLQSEGTDVAEVYRARMAFEPAAVRLVVERKDKAVPAILREALAYEREAISEPVEFALAIAHFHKLLVELSRNRPLIHLWGAIHEVVEQHQAQVVTHFRREQSVEEIIASVSVGLKSQEKLIKLIEGGDADLAEAHWRKHMQAAYNTWVKGYENQKISSLLTE